MPRLPLSLEPQHHTLTNREKEVLITFAKGLSETEAALTLAISLSTIKTHKSTIYRKLGLHTIVDLVHYAIREGLVPP